MKGMAGTPVVWELFSEAALGWSLLRIWFEIFGLVNFPCFSFAPTCVDDICKGRPWRSSCGSSWNGSLICLVGYVDP